MIAVLQRVTKAEVKIEGKTVGQCGKGLMILLGVKQGDASCDAKALAEKIAKFRIFSDADGKMNLSAPDVGGSALVVSNFTLAGSYRHGNRPDFIATAAPPALAERLYLEFCTLLSAKLRVETGVFGAEMEVSLTNDGPVTFVLDSDILLKKETANKKEAALS